MSKRKADSDAAGEPAGAAGGALVAVPSKRARQEIVSAADKSRALMATGPPRTSSLASPTMLLSGHEGEIFSARFSPDGQHIASSAFDRRIALWNTLGDCENYAALTGHTGAITQVCWTPDGSKLFSASTDRNCAVWDAETGVRIRRLRGHAKYVNSCQSSPDGVNAVSGSDDGTIRIWDSRRRHPVHSLDSKFQVTAVTYSQRADELISGGIDNVVKIWDLRQLAVQHVLHGHTDTITSLELSPDGTKVMSNAMDNTVRLWDVQPFAKQRQLKLFQGAQHNFEKNLIRGSWTPDGKRFGCGSADRNVYVWDVSTGAVVYCLPGHKGSVNDVHFHPEEPIVLSASSDRKLFMGEVAL